MDVTESGHFCRQSGEVNPSPFEQRPSQSVIGLVFPDEERHAAQDVDDGAERKVYGAVGSEPILGGDGEDEAEAMKTISEAIESGLGEM